MPSLFPKKDTIKASKLDTNNKSTTATENEDPLLNEAQDAIKTAAGQLSMTLSSLAGLESPLPKDAETRIFRQENGMAWNMDNPIYNSANPSPRDSLTATPNKTPITSPGRKPRSSPGSARKAVADTYPRSFPVTPERTILEGDETPMPQQQQQNNNNNRRPNRQLATALQAAQTSPGVFSPFTPGATNQYYASATQTRSIGTGKIILALIISVLLIATLGAYFTVGPGAALLVSYGLVKPVAVPPTPVPEPSLLSKLRDTGLKMTTTTTTQSSTVNTVQYKPGEIKQAPSPKPPPKTKPVAAVVKTETKQPVPATSTPQKQQQKQPTTTSTTTPESITAQIQNVLTTIQPMLEPVINPFASALGSTQAGAVAAAGTFVALVGGIVGVVISASSKVSDNGADVGFDTTKRTSKRSTSSATTPKKTPATKRGSAKSRTPAATGVEQSNDGDSVDEVAVPRSTPKSGKRLVSLEENGRSTTRRWNRV